MKNKEQEKARIEKENSAGNMAMEIGMGVVGVGLCAAIVVAIGALLAIGWNLVCGE